VQNQRCRRHRESASQNCPRRMASLVWEVHGVKRGGVIVIQPRRPAAGLAAALRRGELVADGRRPRARSAGLAREVDAKRNARLGVRIFGRLARGDGVREHRARKCNETYQAGWLPLSRMPLAIRSVVRTHPLTKPKNIHETRSHAS